MSSLSKNTGAFSSDIRYRMNPSFDNLSAKQVRVGNYYDNLDAEKEKDRKKSVTVLS